MPSAIERARELQLKAEQLKSRQTAESRAHQFDKRRNELAQARANLERSFTPTRLLRNEGRVEPEELPRLGELEDLLAPLRQRTAEQSPEDFTKGNEYKRFHTRLETLAKEMGVLLNTAWKKLQSELPAINDKLLEEIAALPGQQPAVLRVRGFDKELKEKRAQPPRTEEELQALLDLAEKLRAELSNLDDAHYPPAVRQFLRAAQQPNGATLSLLTEEVRLWLEQRKLLGKIKLRWIEGPGGKTS